ncbi:hypothetical protein AAMO2058_000598000 [Amorphochlora amoebiformis]
MDEKQSCHRNPLNHPAKHGLLSPAISAQGGSGGPSMSPTRASILQTSRCAMMMDQKQSYHRHVLPPQPSNQSINFVHPMLSAHGENGSSMNPSGTEVPQRNFMNIQDWTIGHEDPGSPLLPSCEELSPRSHKEQWPLSREGQTGNRSPSIGSHMPAANQVSMVPEDPLRSSVPVIEQPASTHVVRVKEAAQNAVIPHAGVKRKTTSSRGKTGKVGAKRRKARKRCTCPWCGSICESGLPRHIQERCEDGLFRAACDVILRMFGSSKCRVTKCDIKKAYVYVTTSPDFKPELMECIREQMTNRVMEKINRTVRAPRSHGPGFKAFKGLDAMVHVFFWLFGFKMPLAADLEPYNFTGFDAEISDKVKKFIFNWIRMTRKTAGRDGLKAIAHTSQDSLPNGDCKVVLDMSAEDWNVLGDMEFGFLHDESDILKELGCMVEQFKMRLCRVAPTENFAWLRCFLVAFREFSAQALDLKTQPNGAVNYRRLRVDENDGILRSMSTFVMQNNEKLLKSFRDVLTSQHHAAELRLQLLRAILVMPCTSDLINLAEELVIRLSKDVPNSFSSHFGDVLQIVNNESFVRKDFFQPDSARTDICHFVHVQGSRASRMCLENSLSGILEPIPEGHNGVHSTALDLLINRGLDCQAVSSLPNFINTQTLRITSNEKVACLGTERAERFAKLHALIIFNCEIPEIKIDMFKKFPDLRCLRVVSNGISTLSPGVFDHLARLEILDLSSNFLKTLPPGALHACEILREINLKNNEICEISPRAFEGLKSLEILDLSENRLSENCLSENRLKSIGIGAFHTLKSLKELNLSQNQLCCLHKQTFHDLKSLEILDLSENRLKSIGIGAFHTLKSLKKLNLSQNQLCCLHKQTFHGLKSLKELNLSQNKLRSLPEQMFYDLKYLELLDLSKNKLQGLPQEVLQTLSKSVKKVCLDGKELDSELDGEQVGTELDGKQHHIALDGKQLEIVLEGDQLDTSQIKPKKNIHTMDQIPAKVVPPWFLGLCLPTSVPLCYPCLPTSVFLCYPCPILA